MNEQQNTNAIFQFQMANIRAIKCERGHLHPVLDEIVEQARLHQYGVVFPHQVESTSLNIDWIMYRDVVKNVRLGGCPVSEAPGPLTTSVSPRHYPEGSHLFLTMGNPVVPRTSSQEAPPSPPGPTRRCLFDSSRGESPISFFDDEPLESDRSEFAEEPPMRRYEYASVFHVPGLNENSHEIDTSRRIYLNPKIRDKSQPWYLRGTNPFTVLEYYVSSDTYVAWYKLDRKNLSPYELAGRRTMDQISISTRPGQTTPVQAYYDPFAAYNVISNRILTLDDHIKRSGNLPGNFGAPIDQKKRVIVQVPWRAVEFVECMDFIMLDVYFKGKRWSERIPFMISVEREISVIFGREFARSGFRAIKNRDMLQLMHPADPTTIHEIRSIERPGYGRIQILTEEEIRNYNDSD